MYDRFAKVFAALAVIILLTWNSALVIGAGEGNAYHTEEEIVYEYVTKNYTMERTTSEARMIREKTLERKRIAGISAAEYEVLCRIVQAEAGGEDMLGKKMVADVILNRVDSSKFPNTIEGVVFQGSGGKPQFSPIRDGRYYSVTVTEETRKAVNTALFGEDGTQGALYFVNAQKANPGNYAWFESSLAFCGQHGGHRFYK